jgi:ADP-ribose pyrophosphatase YjhB (NUDIX family)
MVMAERTLGVVTVIEHPPASDSFVLIEETKPHKEGRLNLAGGGLKSKNRKREGESIVAAALREAPEETGFDEVELTGFLGLFDYSDDGKVQVAFAARAVCGELHSSPKHPHVESYPFHIIEDYLAPGGHLRSDRVVQAISQFRQGLVLPVEAGVHMLDSDTLPPRIFQPQEQTELQAA